MNVFIDIETLPTEDDETIAVLRENAKAPGNLKDPDKIAAAKEADFQKKWKATALDGTYGTIACICWAIERWPANELNVNEAGNEKRLVEAFFSRLKLALDESGPRLPVFIGHNVGFDLKFLWRGNADALWAGSSDFI